LFKLFDFYSDRDNSTEFYGNTYKWKPKYFWESIMFGLEKITVGKVLKAATVAAGVGAVAIAAPIGVVAVIGLTAAGAGATWLAESVGDELNNNDKDKSDS
jgi:hypothetical protein